MTTHTLKALMGADVPKDRSSVTLKMETDQGTIALKMTPAQLDHFVTSLEGLEQQLTIFDPVKGRAPGEPVEMRFYIVDGTTLITAVVNNVPSLGILIKAGNSTRTYAFDRAKAETLAKEVTAALPMLEQLNREPNH